MSHVLRLKTANEALAQAAGNAKNGKWRQNYHFTAPAGWLNDPNGLIYAKGLYHLFYQHNPHANEWGAMHWGHSVSKDMVNWEHLPIALAPSEHFDDYENGGCFSGSAVEKDGSLYLFYTGTAEKEDVVLQTQCLAVSKDGVVFEKYENNPVIAQYPPGISAMDARDPKVFQHGDRWYMVLGASMGGSENGQGVVLLYRSEDLLQWEFQSVLLSNKEICGTMCECPDLFALGDKWVLTFSPMKAPGYPTAVYMVGTMDFETGIFYIETEGLLDTGFDYYAAQSMLDESGNRVLIAWQNGWSWMPWWNGFGPTDEEGWRGCMTLPRTASLREDGKLCLVPIRQLEQLRYAPVSYEGVKLGQDVLSLHPEDATSFEFKLATRIDEFEGSLEFRIRDSGTSHVTITIDLANKLLVLDAGACNSFANGSRSCKLELANNRLDLDIWVDKSSVEIFADNGAACMTCNIYPEEQQNGVSIRRSGAEMRIDGMELYSIRAGGVAHV